MWIWDILGGCRTMNCSTTSRAGPASVRVLVDFASEHGADPARVLSSGDHLLHTEREGVTDLSRRHRLLGQP